MKVTEHNDVTVFAPASIGNVSVGFDLLGAALAPIDGSLLGDVVSVLDVSPSTNTNIQFDAVGEWAHKLPQASDSNIVVKCAEYYLDHVIKQPHDITLRLNKNLPVGSGLGSSASSVVASLHALNEAFGSPLDNKALLHLMGKFEGQISGAVHYDNVAPSFLGGLQLMLDSQYDATASLPIFKEWFWVIAYSGESLSTSSMRQLLPAHHTTETVVKFGQKLASFVHASHSGNSVLALENLEDVLAEPYREGAIPGFVEAKKAMQDLGMLSVGISGSGPTLFAVTNDLSMAQKAQHILQDNYVNSALNGFVHICKIDLEGSRVLPSDAKHEE